MWAVRSKLHLLKLSSTQCPNQLLRCQRLLTSGIVNHNHTEDVEMKMRISTNNDKDLSIKDLTMNNKDLSIKELIMNKDLSIRIEDITNNKKDIVMNSTNNNETNGKKKFRHRKRHLLRILQDRVAKHKRRPSTIEPLHIGAKHGVKTEVVTVDETKGDLDDTWTELGSASKYERIYPETVTPVATLAHGLERTLFKPGVHLLKNLHSNRHYFTPFLENITQPEDFDYEAFLPYRTASKDKNLIGMAKEQNARYVGSTSSLSGILSHLYFKVSNYRPLDISCLSEGFANLSKNHTRGSRVPKTILLRWKDGVYAVDADKTFDTGDTILSHLGKSMEKVLTMEPNDYERYLKKNSSTLTEEERNAPEAFAYGRIGDVFLRSQLDCYHRNLPRRTFDLKTRATMPVRLDIPHYQDYYNYQLEQNHGVHYSFEREYYDMMRSAFLKYSFQVRIGHMDGIMVTYHNTDKIFGFQYISRSEMDSRLFGTSKMGDEAFKHCLNLMQAIFDKATAQYPKQTLRMTFDASRGVYDNMRVFIEPISEEQEKRMDDMDDDKNNDTDAATTLANTTISDPMFDPISDQVTMYRLYTTSYLNGKKITGPVSVNKEFDTWDVCYKVQEEKSIPNDNISRSFRRVRFNQATIFLPQSDESPKFLQPFKSKRRLPHQNQDENHQKDNDPESALELLLDEKLLQSNEGPLLDAKEPLLSGRLNTQEQSEVHFTTTPTSNSTSSTNNQ